MVPRSAFRSFSVLTATTQNGTRKLSFDCRSPFRGIRAGRWPLPFTEEVFDDFKGSELFAPIYFLSGYWSLEMADSCKEMTTFTTDCGTY